MASEKIIGMMVDKGAPFSMDELREMSDPECWRWVYEHHPPKTQGRPTKPEICFTGFRPEDKAKMQQIARDNGYQVVKSITVGLKTLVTGEAPGPAKLAQAKDQGTAILTADAFLDIIKEAN
jgi:NAD-dependent DNA ligase